MVKGKISKRLYIDSSVNTFHDKTKVLTPHHALSATGTERLSLTLLSFSLRRNFYAVNPTCNTFFLSFGASATLYVHHHAWSLFHVYGARHGHPERHKHTAN